MTKINIIEFTDRAISMPKTPYQINDWEVTSYKNEPMNLWKYFHKNGPGKIVEDTEYVLLSDLALGQGDIAQLLVKASARSHVCSLLKNLTMSDANTRDSFRAASTR